MQLKLRDTRSQWVCEKLVRCSWSELQTTSTVKKATNHTHDQSVGMVVSSIGMIVCLSTVLTDAIMEEFFNYLLLKVNVVE